MPPEVFTALRPPATTLNPSGFPFGDVERRPNTGSSNRWTLRDMSMTKSRQPARVDREQPGVEERYAMRTRKPVTRQLDRNTLASRRQGSEEKNSVSHPLIA